MYIIFNSIPKTFYTFEFELFCNVTQIIHLGPLYIPHPAIAIGTLINPLYSSTYLQTCQSTALFYLPQVKAVILTCVKATPPMAALFPVNN